jgi:predicted adenylyl cyclase CyaB
VSRPRRNVEVKARQPSREASLAACAELGARDLGELWQCDTYFVVPAGRLKLREQRLLGADAPARAELIQYARVDEAAARASRYRIVGVDDAEGLRAALAAALGVRVEVVKRRRLLLWESVRIHLDTVEGLGEFVELESVVEPGDDDAGHHARVAFLRERLGLTDGRLVAVGYADLLERRG